MIRAFGHFLIFISVFLIPFCGCKERKSKFSKGSAVNNSIELFNNIELIPLETTNGSNIGIGINLATQHNGSVYILNSTHKGKYLLVFDQNGTFKGLGGKMGQGAGEYPYLHGFAIDKKNNELWIYPNHIGICWVYNLKNEYLRTFQFDLEEPNSFESLIIIGDSLYIHTGECNFLIFDRQVNSFVDTIYPHNLADYSYISAFSFRDGGLFYVTLYDSIFHKKFQERTLLGVINHSDYEKQHTAKSEILAKHSSLQSLEEPIASAYRSGEIRWPTYLTLIGNYAIVKYSYVYRTPQSRERIVEWLLFDLENKKFVPKDEISFGFLDRFKDYLIFVSSGNINYCFAYIEPYKLSDELLAHLNELLKERNPHFNQKIETDSNPVLIKFSYD
jgi:hypothetical protein